jgi:phage terminase large subunit
VTVLRLPTARVFKPLLEPDLRYLAGYGGRGSAKSHFFGGLAVEESIKTKRDIVCLREVQRSLKFSVKKLIENKISDMNAGWYFEVTDDEIRSVHGGTMIFQGMQNSTAESIKSLEDFDIAWFEEAQTASQRSLDMLRPTLRKPRSQLWFSWNPRLPTDPVDQLFRGGETPPRSGVVEANYTDNPWFPKELYEEMEYDRRRDPDKYAHIWLGGYEKNSKSRVFRNWTIEEFEI